MVKSDGGTPVLLKDVAHVELAGDERRGIAELNGEGEVASGIALQRSGANALTVIDNVKDRLKEIAPSLPEGHGSGAGLRSFATDQPRHRNPEVTRCSRKAWSSALVCIVFLLHFTQRAWSPS